MAGWVTMLTRIVRILNGIVSWPGFGLKSWDGISLPLYRLIILLEKATRAHAFMKMENKVIADSDINTILEALGVVPLPDKDAFDSINLSKYRQTEYYYWIEHNAAVGKTNMIPGKHWSLFFKPLA
jgi:hypothetical protein